MFTKKDEKYSRCKILLDFLLIIIDIYTLLTESLQFIRRIGELSQWVDNTSHQS